MKTLYSLVLLFALYSYTSNYPYKSESTPLKPNWYQNLSEQDKTYLKGLAATTLITTTPKIIACAASVALRTNSLGLLFTLPTLATGSYGLALTYLPEPLRYLRTNYAQHRNGRIAQSIDAFCSYAQKKETQHQLLITNPLMTGALSTWLFCAAKLII